MMAKRSLLKSIANISHSKSMADNASEACRFEFQGHGWQDL